MGRTISWYVIWAVAAWWALSAAHALDWLGDELTLAWVLAWSAGLPLPFAVLRHARGRTVGEHGRRTAPGRASGSNR